MTPAQVLEIPSIEQGPLRCFPHTVSPLEVSLEGIKKVSPSSVWVGAADLYTYEVKAAQAGITLGVLRYKNLPFCTYRTELVGSEILRNNWALTDRWDEHVQAIDAFNLPDPAILPVTALGEDVIPALPKKSFVPLDQIL